MLVLAHEVSQHRPMCLGHADGHLKLTQISLFYFQLKLDSGLQQKIHF
jgi:hypothetical protein